MAPSSSVSRSSSPDEIDGAPGTHDVTDETSTAASASDESTSVSVSLQRRLNRAVSVPHVLDLFDDLEDELEDALAASTDADA